MMSLQSKRGSLAMKVMILLIFCITAVSLEGCTGMSEKSEKFLKDFQFSSGSDLTQEEIDEKSHQGQMRSMR